jgi:hypothetical protein
MFQPSYTCGKKLHGPLTNGPRDVPRYRAAWRAREVRAIAPTRLATHAKNPLFAEGRTVAIEELKYALRSWRLALVTLVACRYTSDPGRTARGPRRGFVPKSLSGPCHRPKHPGTRWSPAGPLEAANKIREIAHARRTTHHAPEFRNSRSA